jgi:hypothetical protein
LQVFFAATYGILPAIAGRGSTPSVHGKIKRKKQAFIAQTLRMRSDKPNVARSFM